jgi:hypothetical protein
VPVTAPGRTGLASQRKHCLPQTRKTQARDFAEGKDFRRKVVIKRFRHILPVGKFSATRPSTGATGAAGGITVSSRAVLPAVCNLGSKIVK